MDLGPLFRDKITGSAQTSEQMIEAAQTMLDCSIAYAAHDKKKLMYAAKASKQYSRYTCVRGVAKDYLSLDKLDSEAVQQESLFQSTFEQQGSHTEEQMQSVLFTLEQDGQSLLGKYNMVRQAGDSPTRQLFGSQHERGLHHIVIAAKALKAARFCQGEVIKENAAAQITIEQLMMQAEEQASQNQRSQQKQQKQLAETQAAMQKMQAIHSQQLQQGLKEEAAKWESALAIAKQEKDTVDGIFRTNRGDWQNRECELQSQVGELQKEHRGFAQKEEHAQKQLADLTDELKSSQELLAAKAQAHDEKVAELEKTLDSKVAECRKAVEEDSDDRYKQWQKRLNRDKEEAVAAKEAECREHERDALAAKEAEMAGEAQESKLAEAVELACAVVRKDLVAAREAELTACRNDADKMRDAELAKLRVELGKSLERAQFEMEKAQEELRQQHKEGREDELDLCRAKNEAEMEAKYQDKLEAERREMSAALQAVRDQAQADLQAQIAKAAALSSIERAALTEKLRGEIEAEIKEERRDTMEQMREEVKQLQQARMQAEAVVKQAEEQTGSRVHSSQLRAEANAAVAVVPAQRDMTKLEAQLAKQKEWCLAATNAAEEATAKKEEISDKYGELQKSAVKTDAALTRATAARAKLEKQHTTLQGALMNEQRTISKMRSEGKQLKKTNLVFRNQLITAGLLEGELEEEKEEAEITQILRDQETGKAKAGTGPSTQQSQVVSVLERRRSSHEAKLKEQLKSGEITFKQYKRRSSKAK